MNRSKRNEFYNSKPKKSGNRLISNDEFTAYCRDLCEQYKKEIDIKKENEKDFLMYVMHGKVRPIEAAECRS